MDLGLKCLALVYAENILALGFYLIIFDFRGCGNSQKDIPTSFGANQKQDVYDVMQEVYSMGIKSVILWGRSMGAVAAIKYLQMCEQSPALSDSIPDITAVIVDSPFSSLKQLIVQIGINRYSVPKLAILAGYHIIKSTLQEKGNFQISQLQLIPVMKNITSDIPFLFLASKSDCTISHSHSQKLYEGYAHCINKRLVYFEGLHNESRDQKYMGIVQNFMREQLIRASLRPYYSSPSLTPSLTPSLSQFLYSTNRSSRDINIDTNNSSSSNNKKIKQWKKQLINNRNTVKQISSGPECSCSIFGRNKVYKE